MQQEQSQVLMDMGVRVCLNACPNSWSVVLASTPAAANFNAGWCGMAWRG